MKTETPRLKAVDAYVASAPPFSRPILQHLREAVHQAAPEVTEAMKWSRPFFLYKGIILCNMAAFKAHCSLGIWGAETAATLGDDGVLSDGGMGSFGRINSLEDLPPRKQLVGYIRHAASLIDQGKRTQSLPARHRVAKPEMPVPEALSAALAKDAATNERFGALSASGRREYCEWIAGAKRSDTRNSRVATAMLWIAEGKSCNWKYETKS